MAIDQFCRYVHLDFEKVTLGETSEDNPGVTELHVKLFKRGSNGYQMTYEGSRGSLWYTPYDSLDCIRNCNVYVKEDFKKMEECMADRRRIRLRMSQEVDGQRDCREGATQLALDDDGNVIKGIDPLAGCFTPNAYWTGTSDLVDETKLPNSYFEDYFCSVSIGSDHAIEVNSISCVDGQSTGLTVVTFSNVQAHASSICGPLYDHLFVRKMDLIDDLEIFIRNRQFLSKESSKSILRSGRQ